MKFGSRLFISAGMSFLVAFALLSLGCGGDDEEKALTVKDFAGSWEATSFVITSNDDPAMSIDLVAMGGAFSFEADDSGKGEGSIVLPAAQGGATLPFTGSMELVDQETLKVTFDQEIPPLLTNFSGPFTLEGDTMTVKEENFNFDFGNGEVPTTATFILVRS